MRAIRHHWFGSFRSSCRIEKPHCCHRSVNVLPFLHHQAGLCLRHMYLTRKITSDLSSQEAKLRKNSSSYGTKSSHMSFSEWTNDKCVFFPLHGMQGMMMAPPPVWLQFRVTELLKGQLHMGKKGCWRISFPPVPLIRECSLNGVDLWPYK